MLIQSQRFGSLEIDESERIRFPNGLVGFPEEREFVLLRKAGRSIIAWLHSTTNPALAFPVVSLDALALDGDYFQQLLLAGGFDGDLADFARERAVMAIVCASQDRPPTVNLLAPIVVAIQEREGAQIFIMDSKYSTMDSFVVAERRVHVKPAMEPQLSETP